jgi:hypothetical protein
MKHAMALALSLALAMSVVGAQAQTAAPAKRKRSAAPKTDPAVTQELSELKQAIDAQQQQIKQLSDQLQGRDQKIEDLEHKLDQSQSAASAAQSKADAAASTASQQAQDVSSLKTDVADMKVNNTNSALTLMESQKSEQKLVDQIKALGKLKFTGDLRLRYEPFIGGGAVLASGDLGDPISTNSTLTGFYTRKPIAIDKAFGVYNPHYFKPFTLTAGKFGYTWLRTELTGDNDLNPEGGSAALAWDWKNGFVNHFGVVAFGTPMLEVGGGDDSYMYGGQVQTGFNILPRVKLSADGAYYNFENADTIAQNQVNGSGANGSATQGLPTPPNFGGTFGFGGSSNTNNLGLIGGKRFYASKFGILDAIARLDFDTGAKRWPVYALFDFAQNTEACDNLGVFFAAGVAAPTCDPHQRHGYWSELKVGQTKNKGDLLLGYTFARIERDAVLAAFNFSDLRQPTNVAEHRIEAYYQAYPHVQVGFTGLIGRQLVTAQSLTEERWLKRFQFDTIFVDKLGQNLVFTAPGFYSSLTFLDAS